MLTIRVSDEEHARLLERCEGKRLAEWMRRGCLGGAGGRAGKKPAPSPPLRGGLGAIGEKMNQTAREGESGHRGSIDRGHVGGAPVAIEGG
ncbi:hypothetical protein A8277_25765 [Salmonella enterica subsp. enterica serovar Typhimurium]|uniref:hypothetical protein n=1 Tax=Salmonella enterica TaxID=28901 RepID=UPI00084AF1A8|nr:hypothetical protein [Salmonella enterica]OEC08975.1 hypothetical protein A8277_25765 [Salmonella enterica subsp. enterica serovar Typhimurium]